MGYPSNPIPPEVNLFVANCEAEEWTAVEPVYSEATDQYEVCPEASGLDLDYDEIELWLGTNAADAASTLPCDLGVDCIDYLNPEAKAGLWSAPDSLIDVRDTADVLMESDPDSVVLLGTYSQEMEGYAAYTATTCAEDACPFYLAQFSLQIVSPMTVNHTYESVSVTKVISDIHVELDRPALGAWLPYFSQPLIIFPPNSLKIRAEVSVTGSTDVYGENGAYDNTHVIDRYVFGYLDGDQMSLGLVGDTFLTSWQVYGLFVEE